jgi:hypothetical protein
VASLTTSAVGIDPQPPSALRVAGGAGPSAMPPLLSDVPHRLRRGGVAYGTAARATPRAGLIQRLPRRKTSYRNGSRFRICWNTFARITTPPFAWLPYW